jgi:hypothetical protein
LGSTAGRIILAFAELDVTPLEAGKFPLTKAGADSGEDEAILAESQFLLGDFEKPFNLVRLERCGRTLSLFGFHEWP